MKSRILIVEDEATEAMNFEKLLKSFGYEVVGIASTGEDAIKMAIEQEPDLVLMDIVLKGEVDGIEAAAKIKEDFNIPVVYLTAHPEQSVIDRAKLTIPYGYLIKPVNQTDLKIAIELALYKYQIENEIRYNENRYRSLFNYMSSGVAVYKAIGNGEDFIIIDFNEAAENIESMKREEIIGKKVTDAFPGVKDFGLFEVLQRVYKTGTPEHYPISQYKDDRITGWRENFIYKLPSHEIVAIYDDVTEQKKAEEAVKESEAYYRTIFAHSGTATLILEEDNIISMANKECEKLSGYLRQEIEGKKRWTDFVVKEDLEQMVRYHQKRRENPNLVPKTYDFRLINKNGQIKYIHLDVGLIPGTKKSVASLIDFTQLKNAENELKHSLKEKEVINQVVMQLVEAKDTSEIYSIIGRSIKNLLPNSYVLITNSDTEMNFRIVEAFGLENKINKLNSILGTDLYKMKFPMFNFSEEDLEKFYSSRLISFDGIYDVAIRKIPRPICKIIEKVY
ncbi:MAG: PAS domain S-box protein, partial [Methanobacterium sp.]|nr:PAS domain S-box protein [Methanobacterium sp.]